MVFCVSLDGCFSPGVQPLQIQGVWVGSGRVF